MPRGPKTRPKPTPTTLHYCSICRKKVASTFWRRVTLQRLDKWNEILNSDDYVLKLDNLLCYKHFDSPTSLIPTLGLNGSYWSSSPSRRLPVRTPTVPSINTDVADMLISLQRSPPPKTADQLREEVKTLEDSVQQLQSQLQTLTIENTRLVRELDEVRLSPVRLSWEQIEHSEAQIKSWTGAPTRQLFLQLYESLLPEIEVMKFRNAEELFNVDVPASWRSKNKGKRSSLSSQTALMCWLVRAWQ